MEALKRASMHASTPAWKQRNREPKTRGIMLRCSESQHQLLKIASLDDEMSQQKVLERIVWPVLEERYGAGGQNGKDDH